MHILNNITYKVELEIHPNTFPYVTVILITANAKKISYDILMNILRGLIIMQKLQIANVLAEQEKKMGKVLDHGQFDLLNVQLRAGEEIPAHSAKNTVIIIVRKGDVVFNVEGEDVQLTSEDVLLLEPNEIHGLKAVTDVDIIVIKIK